MQVSLLCFDGCPNWQTADERLREALTQVGPSDVTVRVYCTDDGPAGSPTVEQLMAALR